MSGRNGIGTLVVCMHVCTVCNMRRTFSIHSESIHIRTHYKLNQSELCVLWNRPWMFLPSKVYELAIYRIHFFRTLYFPLFETITYIRCYSSGKHLNLAASIINLILTHSFSESFLTFLFWFYIIRVPFMHLPSTSIHVQPFRHMSVW